MSATYRGIKYEVQSKKPKPHPVTDLKYRGAEYQHR